MKARDVVETGSHPCRHPPCTLMCVRNTPFRKATIERESSARSNMMAILGRKLGEPLTPGRLGRRHLCARPPRRTVSTCLSSVFFFHDEQQTRYRLASSVSSSEIGRNQALPTPIERVKYNVAFPYRTRTPPHQSR